MLSHVLRSMTLTPVSCSLSVTASMTIDGNCEAGVRKLLPDAKIINVMLSFMF